VSTRDVYRALWRHKLFILVGTAALVAATWYFTTLVTPTYEASVLVRIQQLEEGDVTSSVYALQASERLAETYAEIVDAGALGSRLRDELAGTLPPETVRDTEVAGHPVEGLDLLWIGASSESAETARTVADAAPGALADLVADSGTVGDRVVTVKPAAVPNEPASPDLALNLVIAAAVGLILNGALVIAAEALRDRLIDPRRASASFGLPVLARVPSLSLVRLEPRPGAPGDGRPPGSESGTRTAAFTRPGEPG
jgi:capsular polysaccharide biosynthesis protein